MPCILARQKGITLIELIIAAVTGVVVALSAALACFSSLESIRDGRGEIEMQQEAAYALEIIKQRVRAGNEVVAVNDMNNPRNGAVEIIVKGMAPQTTYFYETGHCLNYEDGAGVRSILLPNSNNYTVTTLAFGPADLANPGENDGVNINLILTSNESGRSVSFLTSAYVRVRK